MTGDPAYIAAVQQLGGLGFDVLPTLLWDVPIAQVERAVQTHLNRAHFLAAGSADPKRLIVFAVIDDEAPLQWLGGKSNIFVFRTSLRLSSKYANEHVLPYVFVTPPPFSPLTMEDHSSPSVAFCGWKDSHTHRSRAIDLLSSDSRLVCDFIIRKHFWAGEPFSCDAEKEFQHNMSRSHFNLCMRGRGNFSMRFYQTLAAGRIPAVALIDACLPFESRLDWHSCCVITKSVEELPDAILDFWSKYRHQMPVVQERCRSLFLRLRANLADLVAAELDTTDQGLKD